MLVPLKTPPQVLYFGHDQLGSTRFLADQAGTVLATFSYGPYGILTSAIGTATTPLLGGSEYRDAESGFYYLRARYYDPSSAQMLTRDPLASLTEAPYGYALDDPLNLTDPTGLCSWNPFSSDSCEIAAPARQATSWAGDIKNAGTQAKNWVADHHDGIITGVGIAAGVVSAATGVGALVDASVLGGEGLLSATSVGTGFLAGGLDGQACTQGDKVACVGMGLGLAGGVSSTFDLMGGLAGVEVDTLPYAVLKGFSAFGLSLGFAGTGFDITSLLSALGGCR